MKYNFEGLIVPSISIFDLDGTLSEKLEYDHVKWLIKNGADGIFAGGTYGSAQYMSKDERIRLFEIVKKATDEEGAFAIAHVGSVPKEEAVELTRAAGKLGFAAVSALEPLGEKLDEEGLLDFYQSILEEAGDMPFFAYNNPAVSGRALSETMLKKLKLMGVYGYKDSTADTKLAQYDCGLKYIAGSSKNWNEMRALGITTVISGMANYAPDIVKLLMTVCRQKPDKAGEAQKAVNALNQMTKVEDSITSTYIALAARGRDAGQMKSPRFVDYVAHIEDMQKIKAQADSTKALLEAMLKQA